MPVEKARQTVEFMMGLCMERFKLYFYRHGTLVPVFFEKQLLLGTFEYTLHHVIDNELSIGFLGKCYNNQVGAPAYISKNLLKIIIFAYSRDIISSRKIAKCCEETLSRPFLQTFFLFYHHCQFYLFHRRGDS